MGEVRNIYYANFAITDRCNRACPECCCNVPAIKQHWDADIEYCGRMADNMRGISHVNLTGGEPTLNVDLKWIVGVFRNRLGCSVTMETNCDLFDKNVDVFREFDEIYVSRYREPDFPSNVQQVERFTAWADANGVRYRVFDLRHTRRTDRGTGSCARGDSGTISIYKGRAYACCMGWGIDNAPSVDVESPGWVDSLLALPLPCQNCFFARG